MQGVSLMGACVQSKGRADTREVMSNPLCSRFGARGPEEGVSSEDEFRRREDDTLGRCQLSRTCASLQTPSYRGQLQRSAPEGNQPTRTLWISWSWRGYHRGRVGVVQEHGVHTFVSRSDALEDEQGKVVKAKPVRINKGTPEKPELR